MLMFEHRKLIFVIYMFNNKGDQLKATTAQPQLPCTREKCSCRGHFTIIVVLTGIIAALVLLFSILLIKVYKKLR